MNEFDPQDYGATFAPLLSGNRGCELGPGRACEEVHAQLSQLTIDNAFASRTIVDRDMAKCCLSGIWLLHNYLDESHTISQDIQSNSGSYWHGIMHRREPDYANAKYWFRRVGAHAIFDPLCVAVKYRVQSMHVGADADFLASQARWDPFRFVDLCQSASGATSDNVELCRAVAQMEWELLFDYCFRQAIT
jgi:hypothetical protein